MHQLIEQLRSVPILKSIGHAAYTATIRISKKQGKIRKGMLIDHKIE